METAVSVEDAIAEPSKTFEEAAIERIEKEIERARNGRKRLLNLVTMADEDDIGLDDVREKLKELKEREAQLLEQKATLEETIATMVQSDFSIQEALEYYLLSLDGADELTTEQKQEIVRMAVREIRIQKEPQIVLSTGQYMFIYVTSPEKKIVGFTKLTSNMKIVEGRWPYSVDLEWVVPIKSGVSFAEVGLNIRPRIGDTLYGITDEKAQEIIEALNAQPDLDVSTLDYLANKYNDRDHH